MVSARRVSTRDIALAGGSLDALITKLIEQVRSGNMEQREVGAMFIHSLTDQPRGLAGEQEAENGHALLPTPVPPQNNNTPNNRRIQPPSSPLAVELDAPASSSLSATPTPSPSMIG